MGIWMGVDRRAECHKRLTIRESLNIWGIESRALQQGMSMSPSTDSPAALTDLWWYTNYSNDDYYLITMDLNQEQSV